MRLRFFTSLPHPPRTITSAIFPAMLPAGSGAHASPAFPPVPPGATTYSPEIVDMIGGTGGRAANDVTSRREAGGVPGPVTVTLFPNPRACVLFATVMTFGLSFQDPVMLLSPFSARVSGGRDDDRSGVDCCIERLAQRVVDPVGRQPAAVAKAEVQRVGLVGDDVLDRSEVLGGIAGHAVAHDVRAGRHARQAQRNVVPSV